MQYGAHIEIQDGGHKGAFRVGPNRKMILQGSSTSVPSFKISPQSEIFFDLTAGLWLGHQTVKISSPK